MKTLYIILFILLNHLAFAQGNLQFNQVKLVTALETVPAGKVWKIESVIYNIAEGSTTYQTGNYGNCNTNDYNSAAIIVAGTPTKVGQGTSPLAYSNGAYVHSYTILPIWLPAGTTLSGGICLNKISVIEFNITP